MTDRLLRWVVAYLLSQLDKDVAAEALVAVLRGAVEACKGVAAKTETDLDDALVAKVGDIVEDLAKVLLKK